MLFIDPGHETYMCIRNCETINTHDTIVIGHCNKFFVSLLSLSCQSCSVIVEVLLTGPTELVV